MACYDKTRSLHNGKTSLHSHSSWKALHQCESGQTLTVWLTAIMVMSSVLMGSAYDMSVAWVHKQWADTAAEAACTAGATDLLYAANHSSTSTPVTAYNFLPSNGGTVSGDCATSSSNAMCYYAKLNGYASGGLTSNTPSNDVQWNLAKAPANTSITPLTLSYANAPAPYMSVAVTENVPVTFLGIFAHVLGMPSSWKTIQVAGHCNCGLEASTTNASTTQTIPTELTALCTLGSQWCTATTSTMRGGNQTAPSGTVNVTVFAAGGGIGPDLDNVTIIGPSASIYYSCNSGSTWTAINGNFGTPNITYKWSGGYPFPVFVDQGDSQVKFTCAVTNTDQIWIYGTASAEWADYCIEDDTQCPDFDGAGIGFYTTYSIPTSATVLHVTNFQNN